MIDLDAKFGFLGWRVVGLVVNLLANGLALYGAVRLIRDGTHGSLLAAGLALSLLCVALLARPDLRRDAEEEGRPSPDGSAQVRSSGGRQPPDASSSR